MDTRTQLIYGSDMSGDDDMRDVLVPPLVSSQQNRFSNGNGAPPGLEQQRGQDTSADSKKWFLPSNRLRENTNLANNVLPRIQAGAVATSAPLDCLYKMNHHKRGKCIIFNHVNFDKHQGLTSRAGSDVDVDRIRATFSRLGFTLVVYKDLKYSQIMENLRTFANEDHSQNDCLVVFVLTHGEVNQLHAYDITYKPASLWDVFTADKCATLAGKPKMFFIQACRGDLYDDGTELQFQASHTQVDGPPQYYNNYRIPNQADFLTVYSTYEGYFSWRNSKKGSYFIDALCHNFDDYCQMKDVLSVLTLVNRDVAICYESRSKDPTQNMKKQIPHVCHTLLREIYLTAKDPNNIGTLV